MQSDQRFHPQKVIAPHLTDEMGNNSMHVPVASAFNPLLPPCAKPIPFHGIEIQPSEVCPRNFIIFDQTDDRNQVMYHPALTRKLSGPALNAFSASLQNNYGREDFDNFGKEASSSLQEDPNEIDALLSFEEEEDEDEEYDEDEEVVSTARTYGNDGDDSSDSCSSYGFNNFRKNASSSSVSSCNNEKKRRMKKMMKVLRGIVPGGEQMNTASVLDEAVRYLKSLKVEAQKLGVGNFTP